MGNAVSAEDPTDVPLKSRFQGVMLGALSGDCLGERYENLWAEIDIKRVAQYYEDMKKKVKTEEVSEKGFVLHTDDSCMTFDLATSLVQNKSFDPRDVVKNFAETHVASSSQRNYGNNVVLLLRDLKDKGYSGDVYAPAKMQFTGNGSYGNGSAMRSSPVTLFHHGNVANIVMLSEKQSRLTHTNPKGINGAVLQALAIEKAMTCGKINDPVKFCDELCAQLKDITPAKEHLDIFEEKMAAINKLLTTKKLVKAGEYNSAIGSDVTAHRSVPAALFCFLYTLNPKRIPCLSKYNGLLRATILAVAYSHDSDTVGSMAGAIAGGYYGVQVIPEDWRFACEEAERALKLADELFELNQSGNVPQESEDP